MFNLNRVALTTISLANSIPGDCNSRFSIEPSEKPANRSENLQLDN